MDSFKIGDYRTYWGRALAESARSAENLKYRADRLFFNKVEAKEKEPAPLIPDGTKQSDYNK